MSDNLMTLPAGIAVYPAIDRPDTKYNEHGTYKADTKFPADVAKPIVDKLAARWKAHTGKVLNKKDNPLFKQELDDDGEPTGNVIFQIRAKNKLRKDGKLWDRRPVTIDAKKNDLPADLKIWGGTKWRVQIEVYEYQLRDGKKGMNLQPVMIQVLELVTGGGKADASAFDEEDGFETDTSSDAGNRSAFDDGDDAGAEDDGSGDY